MESPAPPAGHIVADVIDRQVRPLLRLHGGDCELVSVDQGIVTVRFLMACTACKLRPMTLLAGVRPRLLGIPGVTDVKAIGVGVSSHAVRRADVAFGRTEPAPDPGASSTCHT